MCIQYICTCTTHMHKRDACMDNMNAICATAGIYCIKSQNKGRKKTCMNIEKISVCRYVCIYTVCIITSYCMYQALLICVHMQRCHLCSMHTCCMQVTKEKNIKVHYRHTVYRHTTYPKVCIKCLHYMHLHSKHAPIHTYTIMCKHWSTQPHTCRAVYIFKNTHTGIQTPI